MCQENKVDSTLEQSAYQVLLLMSSETEQGWTWWEKVAHLEDRYLPRVAGSRKSSSSSSFSILSNRSSASIRSASVGRKGKRSSSNSRGGSERSLRQQSLSPSRLAPRPFLLTTLVPNITDEPRIYTGGAGKRPIGDNTRSITDSLICNMAPSALQEGIGLCSILNDTTPAGLPLGMISITSNTDHTSHIKAQPSALRSSSIFHQQQSASSILGGSNSSSSSSSSSSARYNPPPPAASSGTLATDYGRFRSPLRSASPSYSSASMRGTGLGQLPGPPMTAVPAPSSSSLHSPHYLNMSTGSEYFRGGFGLGQSASDINTPYVTTAATTTRSIGMNSPLGQRNPLAGALRTGSPDVAQRIPFRGNLPISKDGMATGGEGTEYYPLGTAAKSPVHAFSPQASGPSGDPAKHWSQMDTLFTRQQVTKALDSSSSPVNTMEQSNEQVPEVVKPGNRDLPDKSPEALKIIPPTSGEKWKLVRQSLVSITGERRPSWGSPKPKQGVVGGEAVNMTKQGTLLTPARTPAAAISLETKTADPVYVPDALTVGGGGSSSSSQISSHATNTATATARATGAPSSLSTMFRADSTEQREPLPQSPFSPQNNNNNNNYSNYNNTPMSMGTGLSQQQQQPWSPTAATNTTNSMYMIPNLVPPRPLLPYKSVESSIQLIGISGSHGAQVPPLYVCYYIYPLTTKTPSTSVTTKYCYYIYYSTTYLLQHNF